MRHLTLVIALIGLAAHGVAQQRPNLSGTWIATKDAPSGVTAAPSPVFGQRFALRVTPEAVTVTRPLRAAFVEGTYGFDGRECGYVSRAGRAKATPTHSRPPPGKAMRSRSRPWA